jgi:hypothetical protein
LRHQSAIVGVDRCNDEIPNLSEDFNRVPFQVVALIGGHSSLILCIPTEARPLFDSQIAVQKQISDSLNVIRGFRRRKVFKSAL